jgi:ABC-type cobalamin/Fe3+-siderophores transport system ATPase subunit
VGLTRVTIKNFKAIEDAKLELSAFNVIVGANGSGKSSVLQALHWMFQSGRNRAIGATSTEKGGATLSEREATYMPSPSYRKSAHKGEYGNRTGASELSLHVEASNEGQNLSASMWIKAARNEGLSVHVPTGNGLVMWMRDQRREFSAYIPGLAGIPLLEEKKSKLVVQRLAAAGDANTVLRNMLELLKTVRVDGVDGLRVLEEWVSQVMGKIQFDVRFDEDRDTSIQAGFQTAEMRSFDKARFQPLELAGIGFLQVTQIFAYLIYFRPVVLLVDEPDSHLHPTAQERLIPVLAEAARQLDTQVILTTHSPSIVRALPAEAKVIWMRGGEVQKDGDTTGRSLMGWGLLDRRLVLITEDKEIGMLQALLNQWPELNRLVAIWPVQGSAKLPASDVVTELLALTGGSLRAMLHRDRDFLMPLEVAQVSTPFSDAGHLLWFTASSDVESYWAEWQVISAHFGIDQIDAEALLADAFSAYMKNGAVAKRRKKRNDAAQKINSQGNLPNYGDSEVEAEARKPGYQHAVLGKELVAAIRQAAQNKKLAGVSTFGIAIPAGLANPLAPDLEQAIRSMIT